MTDITNTLLDQNQKEAELFKDVILNSISEAVLLISGNQYIFANYRVVEMFGYTSLDQIIGLEPGDLSPTQQPNNAHSIDYARQLIEEAHIGTSNSFKWQHKRADGSLFPGDVSLTRIDDTRVIVTITDKTETEAYEQSLIEANELKDQLISTTAHDQRTPLNTILAIANLLKETTDPEKVKSMARLIEIQTEYLNDLVQQTLQNVLSETNELQLNNNAYVLNDVLNGAYVNLKHLVSKKPIDTNLLSDVNLTEVIVGDKTKVLELLINLISNASKFTQEGKIELGVQKLDDKTLEFYVSDTGTGIPADAQKRIFESREQLDTAQKLQGFGLGLSIVKTYAELWGGRAYVQSEPGKGSRFAFTVPYEKGTIAIEEQLRLVDNPEKYKLLIADDELHLCNIFKIIFSKLGFNVVTANSNYEAIKVYETEKPDVVIADIGASTDFNLKISQPDLEIVDNDVLGYFLQRRLQIPIIAMSGHEPEKITEMYPDNNFFRFIPKPVSIPSLVNAISDYIRAQK
jgi:PAS domain S-box-containing protein